MSAHPHPPSEFRRIDGSIRAKHELDLNGRTLRQATLSDRVVATTHGTKTAKFPVSNLRGSENLCSGSPDDEFVWPQQSRTL